jgi:hypothetical protein
LQDWVDESIPATSATLLEATPIRRLSGAATARLILVEPPKSFQSGIMPLRYTI